MTAKPYAEIRSALVEGIRNNPEKSPELKAHAEVLIATIDNIVKHGTDPDIEKAFQENYARFVNVAQGSPLPPELSPEQMAKVFGLGGTSQ